MKVLLVVGFIINLLASCVPPTPIAPPDAELPASYRGVDVPAASFATMPWQQLYPDPVLQNLIATALKNNLTLESAYQVVLEAQANLQVKTGQQQPELNALVKATYSTSFGPTPLTVITNGSGEAAHTSLTPLGGVGVSYEFDLFGKLSSATRQARAQLLASIEGQNGVVWQLVASVAGDYFTLREQDAELQIARNTLVARKANLDLVQARYEGGISDLLSVRQAEESYYQVAASIPELAREIAVSEDALSTLIGSYPRDVPRGLALDQQIALPAVPPAGLPSELLARRPDIMQAEANLAAASANVDVARALLYPQLSIGGSAGLGATAINSTFYGPEGLISLVPQLVAPIFNGGALKANVALTEAQRQQVALSYLQTVQTAMQEVADGVASYDDLRDASTQADQRTAAAQDATRLANLRYEGGVSSYLEVLDSETRAYQDELASVQAHLSERLALVRLYLALGGGWQPSGS